MHRSKPNFDDEYPDGITRAERLSRLKSDYTNDSLPIRSQSPTSYEHRFYNNRYSQRRYLHLNKDEVIEYCPHADVFLFLRHMEKILPMVFIGVLIVFVMGITFQFLAPMIEAMRLTFIQPLKPYLVGETSQNFGGVIDCLSFFSTFVYGGLAVLAAWWAIATSIRPTHLGLEWDAICIVRKMSLSSYEVNQRIRWSEVEKITVERPAFIKSSMDYVICIQTRYEDQAIRFRFGDIFVPEERSYFINYLQQHFKDFDQSDLEVLKPPDSNLSYTELWLLELSAPPKRDKLTPLAPGAVLNQGKYRVISKIGVGGQGTVYYAHAAVSEHVASEVVLKEFVLPVFPDARVRRQSAEKFQEEANMLGKLDHPQIVDFLDLFLEDHRAYLVLEKVDGMTLKELVEEEGSQPERFVLELMLSMTVVLDYLHGQSPPIIHRDFTPDNLILEPDGNVKLIDFSVAQKIENDITGSVVGKANYIAPEQFRGKPTIQSDIYSLGATCYYLLTGTIPDPISRLRPQAVKPEISSDVDAIIASCTHLDPEKRYKSVSDLRADITRL